MAATTFEMTKSWGKLRMMLDPTKFKAALDSNIGKATLFNAKMVEREIRQRIVAKKYAAGAPLTALIKGSSKPLVDHADMMNACAHEIINSGQAWVGVKRTAVGGAYPGGVFNLAVALHEGTTITVTPAMRGLFWMLFRATRAKDPSKLDGRALEIYSLWARSGSTPIYPLKETTTQITIPPRPFIRAVFDDKIIADRCKKNWEKAVNSAISSSAK